MGGGRVDNSEFYQESEFPLKDKVFNWIVRRYERNGHEWKRSDDIVWRGSIYHVFDFFWMCLIVWLLIWSISLVYNRFGMFRALQSIMVIVLLRLAMISRKVSLLNRQLATNKQHK
jgi:hypothetical protein